MIASDSELQLSGRRIQVIRIIKAGKACLTFNSTQLYTTTLTLILESFRSGLSIPVCELDSLFHQSRARGALSKYDARKST